jgi:hypothetical protein
VKVAICYDAERRIYSMLGGSQGREFTEAELRVALGEALAGTEYKPTDILAEARREGAALLDCKPILKGLEMKRRPPNSQYANRTNRMIESVLRGADPARVVNRLAENIPEDVYIKVFVEGDALVVTDAFDQVILEGQNKLVDEIRAMFAQIAEQDGVLGWSSNPGQVCDGFEGPLQMLYTRMREVYGRSASTSFAQYPQVDNFQRQTFESRRKPR